MITSKELRETLAKCIFRIKMQIIFVVTEIKIAATYAAWKIQKGFRTNISCFL